MKGSVTAEGFCGSQAQSFPVGLQPAIVPVTKNSGVALIPQHWLCLGDLSSPEYECFSMISSEVWLICHFFLLVFEGYLV